MKLSQIILLLLLCGSIFSCQSKKVQSTPMDGLLKSSLNDFLEEYAAANKSKDFPKVLDMIYPKLYEIVPKEMMLAQFESMEGETGMTFEMPNFEITNISEAFNHEDETFVHIDYMLDMSITMPDMPPHEHEDGEEHDEAAEDDGMREFMVAMMEMKYGEGNVKMGDDGVIHLKDFNTMYAITPTGSTDWKVIGNEYIENDAFKDMGFDIEIIPKAVLSHFEKK